MIKLFRQNVLLQFTLILAVGVALWLPALLEGGVAMPDETGAPLYGLLYEWLSPHPLLSTLIGLVLVLAEGWALNTLLYNNKLIHHNTLLPMLCYVALMSHGQMGLTPMVLVNLVLLVCVGQLMVPENLTITLDRLFLASCLVAVASLFYLPAVILLLPLAITFIVHSLYRWRQWVMLLLGFLAPYVLVVIIWFLTDRLNYNLYLMRCMLGDAGVVFCLPTSTFDWMSQVFILGLLIVSLGWAFSSSSERTTMYRENMTTICIPLLASMLMLAYSGLFPVDMQLLAMPAATLIASWFLARTPRKRLGSVLYDIIFILFIALCY